MAKKVIFKLGTFFVVLLSMVSAALYYGKKASVNIDEKISEISPLNTETTLNKTVSADIPIIKIGDCMVYYPEFEFYLLSTKKDFEVFLGNGVWNVTKNGRSIEELL